jgi:hypothetical protein
MTLLRIENDGPAIISTNYWDSDYASAGAVFLSVNVPAFRLLLPDSQKAAQADMRTASEVIVSRGLWPARGRNDAIELLFDGGSDNPFCLHFGAEQIDRMPLDSDVGKECVCSV